MNRKTVSILLGGIITSFIGVGSTLAIQLGYVNTGKTTTFSYHSSEWVKIYSKTSGTLGWFCPSRGNVVSGGFETRKENNNIAEGFTVVKNTFVGTNKWEVRLRNQDDLDRDVKIYVVCAH